MSRDQTEQTRLPRIVNVGLCAVLVSFCDELRESANRAALAFRAELEKTAPEGVLETSTSLTSVLVVYDPARLGVADLHGHLTDLLQSRQWEKADLPDNRRLWLIPTVFGGAHGPQLQEAAALAGLSEAEALRQLSAARLRVMTIGFAPGQPYLGSLAPHWDIPRQSGLTKQVPAGAIAVAIRQLVMFTTATPTGWRWVGQTGFRGFRPESETPFALRPGDEVQLVPVSTEELEAASAGDQTGDAGATWEIIA